MDQPEPRDVLDALGLPAVRVGILRSAALHDSVTAELLMTELRASRTTINRHIAPLVAAGLLRESPDPSRAGMRAGFNRLLWSLDRDALAAHLAALEAELTGKSTPA